jgi:hypothetical protein
MKPDSRQIVHLGIHWIFASPPVINSQTFLMFQQALISHSIEITNTSCKDNQITIVRDQPIQLRIMVIQPPKQPTGELLIFSQSTSLHFESFVQDTEFVVTSFDECWQLNRRQILSQDVTIRELHETEAQHAFQEIWETRLKQPGDSLAPLGGKVLGGGLRFVIPPQDNMPAQKEIKIESFLQNAHKIFIETQFIWHQPTAPGTPFTPREKLTEVDNYARNEVYRFISGVKK